MLVIHEELLHSIQHEVGTDGQWANETVGLIAQKDPVMLRFLQEVEDKVGSYGLTYVLLIYKLLQSQHEVNELEDD